MSSEHTDFQRDDDDVTFIAQFLGDSHPSDFSVMKELLQNAHDAGATRLDIVLHEGLRDADAGPILSRAGILVLNDGEVDHRNLEAIGNIQRTTKAQDEGRIGRFGRGQKAVFRWSDAFVALSLSNDQILTRLPRPINKERDDWRAVEPAALRRLFESFGAGADDEPSRRRGLALWLPLRKNSDPSPKVFTDSLDLNQLSNELLRPKDWLAATVSLGLHHVRVWHSSASSDGPALHLDLSHRQRGHLRVGDVTVRFWQSKARQAAGDVRHASRALVDHPLWPRQMQRQDDGTPMAVKQKASFHARVTIIRQPVVRGEVARLSVRWAVSLPLDDSPVVEQAPLPDSDHHITVLLDGSFFLDSGRRAPLGINERRHDREIQDEVQIKYAWNQAIRDDDLLPLVVPTLAAMAKKIAPDEPDEMLRIVDALAKTPLLENPFALPVLKKKRLVAALERTDDGGLAIAWKDVDAPKPGDARKADDESTILPLDLPEGTSLDVLAECFPNLLGTTESTANGSGPHVVHRDWSGRLGGEIDAAPWHDQLNRLATTPDLLFADPRHLSTVLSIWEKNVAPLGESQRAWLRNRRLDLARDLLQHSDWGPDVGAVKSKEGRWPAAKALFESVQDRIVVVDPSGFAVEFDALARALAAERTGRPLLLLRKPKDDGEWSLNGNLQYAEDDDCFDRLVELAAEHLSSGDARARVLTAALQRVAKEQRSAVLERPAIVDARLIQASTGQQCWLSPEQLRHRHASQRVLKKWLSGDSQRPTLPDIRDCLPGLDIAEVREEPHPELARIILGEPLAELTPQMAFQWAASSRAFGGTGEQRCRFAKFLLMADVADIRPVRSVIAGRVVEHPAELFIGPQAAKPGMPDAERERIANNRRLHDQIALKNDRFLDGETSDVVRSMLTTNDFTRLLVEPTSEETLEAALDADLCSAHWVAVADLLGSIDTASPDVDRLKETVWLPLESGGAVKPSRVLRIGSEVQQALRALPGSSEADFVLFDDLARAFRAPDRWRAIRDKLLPDQPTRDTLDLLFVEVELFLPIPSPVLPIPAEGASTAEELLSIHGMHRVVDSLQPLSPSLQFVARLLAVPIWDPISVLTAAKDVMVGTAPDIEVLRQGLVSLEELAREDDSLETAAPRWHRTICEHLRERLPRDELQDFFATRMLPTQDGVWRPTAQLVRAIAGADGPPPHSQQLHEDWDSALFAERPEPDLAGIATLEPQRDKGAIDPRDSLPAKDVLPGLVRDLRPIASPSSLAGLVIALAPFELEDLARDLLSESPAGEFDNLRRLLLDAQHGHREDDVKRMRLAFSRSEVSSDAEARTATSIVGHEVPLEPSDRPELFRRLRPEGPEKRDPEKPVLKRCVKDGDGYRWCLVVNTIDTTRWSEQETRLAIQDAIRAIYNEVLGAFPTRYIERLQELASGAQTSVKVSQARIVESMHLERIQSETLRRRLRNLRSSYGSVVLGPNESDKSKSQQQQLEEHQRRIEDHQQQTAETVRLISTDTDVANDLLRARRAGIERFDYAPSQILFELFQNADDALSQLLAAPHPPVLSSDERLFIVWRTPNGIAVAYGGRAINQVLLCGDRVDHLGYDADLEHMCRLGSSSKGQKADTGQFGLGFKSVFLISSEPCIQSGSLGFALLGGMLPFEDEARWRPQTQRFYETACRRLPYATKTTTISLPQTASDDRTRANEAFQAFKAKAMLLPYFAKAIRTVEVVDEDENQPPVRFQAWRVDDRSDCVHSMSLPGVQYLGLSSAPLTDGNAWRLVMELRDDRPAKLNKHLSGLWNVAPTSEGKALGFALNGPVQLDAGRGSIARNRTHDLASLKRAGQSIGQTVLRVFADEGLDWWSHFWSVFGEACNEIGRPDDVVAEQLLAFLGGDEHVSGLLRLLAANGRLPNGLGGDLARLTDLARIRFQVPENAVSELPRLLEEGTAIEPEQCISATTAKALARLRLIDQKGLNELDLRAITERLIKAWSPFDQAALRRLSEVVTKLGPNHRNHVLDLVRSGSIVTQDQREHPMREVVVPWSDEHDIAPDSRAVAGGPMERLEHLEECFRRRASPSEVGKWIAEAHDHARRQKALKFLVRQGVQNELADEVRRRRSACWLEELRTDSAFEKYSNLSSDERSVLLIVIWGPQARVDELPAVTVEPQRTPHVIAQNLRNLEEWWSHPGQTEIRDKAHELNGVYAAVGLSSGQLAEVLKCPAHDDPVQFTWFRLLCALNALGAWPFDWDKAVEFIDRAHHKGVFDSIWQGDGEGARTKALNDLFSTDSDTTNYWRHLLDFEKLASLIRDTTFAERILFEAQSAEGRHTVAQVAHNGKAPGVPYGPAARSSLKKYVFLLLRELHRLGIAPQQPHGFFPPTRVLQLCYRLGLTGGPDAEDKFGKLCGQVADIVGVLEDHEELTALRKWRDAPFFAYAKTMCKDRQGCGTCRMICPEKNATSSATRRPSP